MTQYFANSYTEAEANFSAGCAAAGVEPEWIEHPRRGPAGELLHVGVAHLGDTTAARQLLVISGTHGIEGYAGSALQAAILQGDAGFALPADTGVLLIHLINPWGVAWICREDHDNVDLFRNFHYCDASTAPDPLYDEIVDGFAPATWTGFEAETIAAVQAQQVEKFGQDRIIEAIRRGQHHRPKGMTYHGNGPCWSKQVLDRIVAERLAGAAQIAVVDVHTGFGDFGGAAVVAYDAPGSERYRRVCDWYGDRIYTPGEDADTPTHAIVPFGFIETLCPGSTVTCGVLEYGTYEPDSSRDAFLAVHWYHQYGDPLSAEAAPYMQRYRDYLYPNTPAWNASILQHGIEVLQQAINGLQGMPVNSHQ